jgi:PPE-repeat protein
MDFAMVSPEVNSGRMYAGPGSGPMLAAAAAWDALAVELHSAAASYASVISGLTAGPWLGRASVSMAAAASPYALWMSTTAAQSQQTAIQLKGAAAAYEVTFAAMVPPWVIAANRAQLMALLHTNIFGQNTPAIMATEAHYAEMWAQDAAAMYGYAGVSASATMLTPFTPPPQTTSRGVRGDQTAALAKAAGTSAATKTQAALAQLTTNAPAELQGLASPAGGAAAAASSTSIFDILSSLGLISPSTILEPAALGLGSGELTTASGAWADAAQGDDEMSRNQEILTARIGDVGKQILDQLGVPRSAAPVLVSAASAGLGQAESIGALSVPPGWTTAAPEIRLATLALPATSLGAAPEAFAGGSAGLFGEMTLASMAGQALNGTVGQGRRERIGAPARARPAPGPGTPGSRTPAIADEIREFADLLCKLGDLRDAGLLTDEEFNEQKQRLLSR